MRLRHHRLVPHAFRGPVRRPTEIPNGYVHMRPRPSFRHTPHTFGGQDAPPDAPVGDMRHAKRQEYLWLARGHRPTAAQSRNRFQRPRRFTLARGPIQTRRASGNGGRGEGGGKRSRHPSPNTLCVSAQACFLGAIRPGQRAVGGVIKMRHRIAGPARPCR